MPMPSLYEIMIGPYTQIIGQWFWAAFLIIGVAGIYIRTNDFGPTFLVLLIGSTILRAVIPGGPMDILLFFSAVLGITYVLYQFFVGRA